MPNTMVFCCACFCILLWPLLLGSYLGIVIRHAEMETEKSKKAAPEKTNEP